MVELEPYPQILWIGSRSTVVQVFPNYVNSDKSSTHLLNQIFSRQIHKLISV